MAKWVPNPRMGAKGYYAKTCCLCDLVAWYRVGVNGYCKRHKPVSDALRAGSIRRWDAAKTERERAEREWDRRVLQSERRKAVDPRRSRKPKG